MSSICDACPILYRRWSFVVCLWVGECVGGWLLWLLQHIVDTRGVEDIVQAEADVVG